jgi:hypothetical protein
LVLAPMRGLAQKEKKKIFFSSASCVSNGSIGELAAQAHERHRHTRLNTERVRRVLGTNGSWLSDPYDYKRILELCVGMRIITHPDWIPQVRPPKKRGKYLAVAPAVNKLLYEQYKEGTLLLVLTRALEELPAGSAHFGPQHWATKAGKACGRAITDASHLDKNCKGHPVNGNCKAHTDWVRTEITRVYGDITMPTLDELMLMIKRAAEVWGWSNIVLFKVDLHGAFNLINIHPDDVWKMIYELTEGPHYRQFRLCGNTCCIRSGVQDTGRLNKQNHGRIYMVVRR